MYLLSPIDVVDSVLTASSLSETDYTAWSAPTSYSVGDRAMVTTTTLTKTTGQAWAVGDPIYWNSTSEKATTTRIANGFLGHASATAASGATTGSVAVHAIYEATGSNSGTNPVSNAMLPADDVDRKWVKVGATNKWKPFDETMSDPATSASDITYTLAVSSLCTGLAFFGVAASSITVEIRNGLGETTWTETRSLVDTSSIVDWWTFYTWEPEYDTEALFAGFSAPSGYTIHITIAGSNVQVSEIVLGKVIGLGRTLPGTEIGFEDFSRKDRDDWGNAVLVEREYADTVTFRFTVPITDARRVKRVIADHRARPAVWFAGTGLINRGATIYGFPSGGLRLPLEVAGRHFASLEIEGLT